MTAKTLLVIAIAITWNTGCATRSISDECLISCKQARMEGLIDPLLESPCLGICKYDSCANTSEEVIPWVCEKPDGR